MRPAEKPLVRWAGFRRRGGTHAGSVCRAGRPDPGGDRRTSANPRPEGETPVRQGEIVISTFLDWLWRGSWQGAILAGLVMFVGIPPIRGVITPRWRLALWTIVLLRLILPISPQCRFNLFQFN